MSKITMLHSTESTMLDALHLYEEGKISHLDLVCALEQTAGKGRIPGRKWISEVGKSILCTFVVKPEHLTFPTIKLPLLVGTAVCRLLQDWGLKSKIKWPNDIIVNDKKICGILCEYQSFPQSNLSPIVLCGIGLNLNQAEFNNYRIPPTSFFIETFREINIETAVNQLADCFSALLSDSNFLETKWDQFLFDHLYRRGEPVLFKVGNPEENAAVISGKLIGIDSDGMVIIEDKDKIERKFISGEFV